MAPILAEVGILKDLTKDKCLLIFIISLVEKIVMEYLTFNPFVTLDVLSCIISSNLTTRNLHSFFEVCRPVMCQNALRCWWYSDPCSYSCTVTVSLCS